MNTRPLNAVYSICIITLFTTRLLADSEADEKFIEMYGKTPSESGRWELISKSNDLKYMDKLNKMAEQAHRQATKKDELVMKVFVHFGWLCLYDANGQKYPYFSLDMLGYKVKGSGKNPTTFYITKGLGLDCVYYLKAVQGMWTFGLDKHVCGIEVPVL